MAIHRESAPQATPATPITSIARQYNVGRAILYGAVAGLVAGIVFGLMMQMMMPMMMNEMIGKIVGQPNPVGSWVYHLFNSAVIGAIFGFAFGRIASNYGAGALWGALYGVIWWVLGPLILMPLLLGMTNMLFAISSDTLMSLVGHIIYGLITGLGYVFLRDRL